MFLFLKEFPKYPDVDRVWRKAPSALSILTHVHPPSLLNSDDGDPNYPQKRERRTENERKEKQEPKNNVFHTHKF